MDLQTPQHSGMPARPRHQAAGGATDDTSWL